VNGFLGVGEPSSVGASKSNLRNIFNFAMPAAKGAIGQASQDLGASSNYWQNLLTGNRQATAAATAPQTNTANAQADASRRQQAAMGTARGGGTASTNQTQKDATLAKIQTMLFGQRSQAAGELGKNASTGYSAGGNLLNTGESSSKDLGDIGVQQEKVSAAGPLQQGLGDLLQTAMGGATSSGSAGGDLQSVLKFFM
jgi:hypothetical protein